MNTLNHRGSNRIKRVSINNQWIDKKEEMCSEAVQYFSTLLFEDCPLDLVA